MRWTRHQDIQRPVPRAITVVRRLHTVTSTRAYLSWAHAHRYGSRASHKDPARYSFAHEGKDGTPYPVDRSTYDKTIDVTRDALNGAKIDRGEKVRAFRRLAEFAG